MEKQEELPPAQGISKICFPTLSFLKDTLFLVFPKQTVSQFPWMMLEICHGWECNPFHEQILFSFLEICQILYIRVFTLGGIHSTGLDKAICEEQGTEIFNINFQLLFPECLQTLPSPSDHYKTLKMSTNALFTFISQLCKHVYLITQKNLKGWCLITDRQPIHLLHFTLN